jgi:hypothetical protein
MTKFAPPPTDHITETREGDGYVLSCPCRWLRWLPTHPDADAGRREHVKRCKVARGEGDE